MLFENREEFTWINIDLKSDGIFLTKRCLLVLPYGSY